MRIFCPTCQAALQFDEKKVNAATINLRCFKCTHIFEVNIPLLKQQASVSEEEKTVIENLPTSVKKEETKENELGWIVVHDENTESQVYSLKIGKNTIGRKSESVKVDIGIETTDKYMSRNHCAIEVNPNRRGGYDYILSNSENKNGVYINADREKKLKSESLIFLEDGNTIQIGRTKIVLKIPDFAANKDIARQKVVDMDYNQTIID